LKPLPSSLRYAFDGRNSTYHMIVNASLSASQIYSLLRVLKLHRKAKGKVTDDLKGIHPSVCMHHVLIEDDHKPSIEHKSKLNPNIKKVVKRKF